MNPYVTISQFQQWLPHEQFFFIDNFLLSPLVDYFEASSRWEIISSQNISVCNSERYGIFLKQTRTSLYFKN